MRVTGRVRGFESFLQINSAKNADDFHRTVIRIQTQALAHSPTKQPCRLHTMHHFGAGAAPYPAFYAWQYGAAVIYPHKY